MSFFRIGRSLSFAKSAVKGNTDILDDDCDVEVECVKMQIPLALSSNRSLAPFVGALFPAPRDVYISRRSRLGGGGGGGGSGCGEVAVVHFASYSSLVSDVLQRIVDWKRFLILFLIFSVRR
jgi:hypothetical protein